MGSLRVIIRLPDSFKEDEKDDGLRMLERALCGLPVSPRLWAKTLGKDLRELGWQESATEPGVWIMKDDSGTVVCIMTTYVDDCMLGAKSKEKAETEANRVHLKHPVTRIKMEVDADGALKFDLLGADVEYNAVNRSVKISMHSYAMKMLKRFDLLSAKPRTHPGFPEENLYNQSSKPSEYPFRAAIGALQWMSTICRPDLAHSTNALARASANKVTKAMQIAATLVLKYVVGTTREGLIYSPESEKEFKEVYGGLLKHADNKGKTLELTDQPVHTFTDASFGVTYRDLKSISGAVIFLHGTPVAWKTKVQSVFATSTSESEFIGISDGLAIGEGVQSVRNFIQGTDELATDSSGPIWVDNRSAVLVGRKGLEGTDEIPKKSRHVALRYAAVLRQNNRLLFVPTDLQKADGLTKSCNAGALQMLFRHCSAPAAKWSREQEKLAQQDFDESLDHVPAYLAIL
jgi:hypothetical protein